MGLKVKVSNFFIDNHGPELLLIISSVVIVVLMIQDVISVVRP
ncbi:hypothetical protein [Desulfosporosinus lacus]|uniref:Uncharacterized protein n=1 Tax=Desulfosporosinus lacus DSM 15449 TaxID=1121420 RepID=A0A1M6B1T3_9FIRM|nr:hypothetical protein [Desulfosporosinus lacus]SHI42640.1 hypothetical protein SAMN02746098_04050 [Desulfosporosinus lacus DSM 15449]